MAERLLHRAKIIAVAPIALTLFVVGFAIAGAFEGFGAWLELTKEGWEET